MPGIALNPGEAGLLLERQSLAAGTHNSDDYWLLKSGGGIVTLDVSDIGTGVVTEINIQAKNGDNYDTVFPFPALGINANGRYRFRILPASDDAAAWPYGVQEIMPPVGRVEIVTTTGAVECQITLEALEF